MRKSNLFIIEEFVILNLEVFNIFNDLHHVIIGIYLIMQYDITISNLAMNWDDDNNYEISLH